VAEQILFKSEDSLWQMLRDGRKTWEARWWETSDERCYKLIWGTRHPGGMWVPDVKEVSFVNKVTGEVLTFEYKGVECFPWAPAWGFIMLGALLRHETGGEAKAGEACGREFVSSGGGLIGGGTGEASICDRARGHVGGCVGHRKE